LFCCCLCLDCGQTCESSENVEVCLLGENFETISQCIADCYNYDYTSGPCEGRFFSFFLFNLILFLLLLINTILCYSERSLGELSWKMKQWRKKKVGQRRRPANNFASPYFSPKFRKVFFFFKKISYSYSGKFEGKFYFLKKIS
jgi:hypothetical protein